jgi:ParB family chromosome partitioning protein
MGIRLTDFGHGRVDAPRLDPREIIIRKNWNYRDMTTSAVADHIAFLKASIAERGVQEPISVELVDGKIYLVNGECRLRALQQLWNEGNEVFVLSIQAKGDEAEILAKSMVANGSLPPTVLEFGSAAERLMAFGWDAGKIAALTPPHLGLKGRKAEQYVKQAVELQQAPIAVKEAVAHGVEVEGKKIAVSPALAVQETRKSREKAPEALKKAAVEAKAAGKKEAKRPKGAGKITKAKVEAEKRVRSLEKIGDDLAKAILDDAFDVDRLQKLAAEWQCARVLQ